MKKIFKLTGCFTWTFTIISLVYYIIMMVNEFTKGVDGGTGFFLVVGLIALLVIGCGLGCLFMSHAMLLGHVNCGCNSNRRE